MKYIMILVVALIFSACGNDSESKEKISTQKTIVDMEYGKIYNVKKGDKLVKTTENTVVKITKKVQEDTTEVVLVEGEAQIIFKK